MENLNYGIVGNGRTAALISETGSVDWFCVPDFDSPSIFARILDKEKGGCLGFLVGDGYRISQTYVEHTNILLTTFTNEGEGSFEVFDFMPLYRTFDTGKRYMPAELYRLIHVKSGSPRIRVDFAPKLNYARDDVSFKVENDHIKVISSQNNKDTVYLYSTLDFRSILEKKEIILTGDQSLMVSYNQKLIDVTLDRVRLEYSRTKVYWLNWTIRSKKFSKYGDYIERSMLVLSLLSYRRTGAIVAAVTTGIPETPGGVRNWDYRYCWLRDASMSIETLLQLGHRNSAGRFMDFIQGILRSKYDRFQIIYGIRGETKLTETELTNLRGFRDSRPVRIGNEAYQQKQNDSYGYLMNMIYSYYSTFQVPLDEIEDMFEVVKHLSRIVTEEWRDKDSGIWEMRGKKAHFVSSKVMSWVALDRASKFAAMLHREDYTTRYAEEAKRIREDIFRNGWKEGIQSFSQTYDNEELDASLLLMEPYGFIDAGDERYVKTVNTIYEKLSYKGLLFRYRDEDDFGTPSSAFVVCSFWMVRGLFVTGRKEEARSLFERLLGYSNHLKLFSEDIDFDTKELLGNFPQAYSHLALIDTALLFTEEKEVYKFLKP
ncbi:MAG: glycoside hydrolase family 15 protein [Bacteroidales bacterium]|nr:glycoside hydrolase family 15 protein [Bacteroidales bacterium]MCI2122415.1 glycoside hydrolase family 15 protein [Bacteroidales bacterium]MCI2144779.1 glycoside hydrolase family 15 protein [Bacteroidales bacterium]